MATGWNRIKDSDVRKLSILLLQRIVLGVVTALAVSMVIFFSVQMLPGDFASAILGQSATPETVSALRTQLGLAQPSPLRYVHWIEHLCRGDLGFSFSGWSPTGGRSVSGIVLPRLGNTLFLACLTALIAVPVSLVLGITAAIYRNSWYDRVVNLITLGAISFPEFFIAYLMILFMSSKLGIFPSIASIGPDSSLVHRFYVTLLPALTLTLIVTAHMMRMTRTAIVSLLTQSYVEMANLKGLRRTRIIALHILPNAVAAIANVIAFNLAYLVVGVVIIEVIFVYPGMGQLMVDSVASRDIPVVQACALLFGGIYIVLNLFADVASILCNPRLLHPR
ncbi:Glutathione transport system permease protein GsiC [Paraburkholderia rhynchosiae]|uniref:Glutathione transport system permease protein GsiC n=1 Tax=Paraburkholderia rhynchosiae TaxID=487049 RepID=A0A6J5AT52_9BURK|nr:Glutathione transport system permease protein GsiC [Paraburkholderia rhynchosiae]